MASTNGKRLLLVDDEIDIAESLKFFLDEQGYEVDTVSSGAEALESLSGGDYQGLVLDWIMPDMTGKEVLDKLSEQDKNLPVMVISAAPPNLVEPNLEEGVRFLRKPFDIDDFLSTLSKVV